MSYDKKYQDFANRLSKLYSRLSKLAKKRAVSCYRLYDLDMPEFPFLIDVYDSHLYVAEYERNHHLSEEDHKLWLKGALLVMEDVMGIPQEKIHLKIRRSIKQRQEQYGKTGEKEETFEVIENEHKFIINLSDYLDTGLFLDHRITRKMVQEQSNGKHVLNLFAYTGSFSVYAAAGGADRVMTMDLSNKYLDWSKQNMELNGFKDNSKYLYIPGDVLQNIELLKWSSFDIIILDPPSFSNSAKMTGSFDVQRDHWWLINKCLPLLKEDGIIYFSTNYSKFKLYDNKLEASSYKDITNQTKDFDFERKLNRYCYIIKK